MITLELPDPGEGRRWSITRESSGLRCARLNRSDIDSWDEPWGYEITLQRETPASTRTAYNLEAPPWYNFWKPMVKVFYEVDIPGDWVNVRSMFVPDLEDESLISAATLVLERINIDQKNAEFEKSRLGTYPPLRLSDSRKEPEDV